MPRGNIRRKYRPSVLMVGHSRDVVTTVHYDIRLLLMIMVSEYTQRGPWEYVLFLVSTHLWYKSSELVWPPVYRRVFIGTSV